jgi:hypothetical protein
MCTVLLPPGVNPIAVNKYIISHHIISWQLTASCYERQQVLYQIVTHLYAITLSNTGGMLNSFTISILHCCHWPQLSEFDNSQSCDVYSSYRNAVQQNVIKAISERSHSLVRLPVTFQTVPPVQCHWLSSLRWTNLTAGLLSIHLKLFVLRVASIHIVCPIKCSINPFKAKRLIKMPRVSPLKIKIPS